ncbi:hypothetical protein FA15DRAFT_759207 [Coprinopsis marcescibilis]|uniref:Uncharacterized protein n=1 Tax=Coprinopsis marcescibilis TaxID=230819 RepID=A0A5C3KK05_COPMA|nr:hypothetical protein FA15DRAFT_759207 [Coprinopsis marcescibilis]
MHERLADSEKKASESLDSSAGTLQKAWKELSSPGAHIPWVKISTSIKDTDRQVMRKMFVELADVTRQTLRGVEDELWIPWAAAQQVNARQKVKLSVFEGAKKYWIDLGKSIVFEGEMIIDCIRRIHDDILLVWNFNDPDKILSSPEFFSRMLALVAPPADDLLNQTSSLADGVSTVSDLISLVQVAGATALALPLSAISLGILALRFLYGKYQKYPSTAKFLATYIVNLVVILHGIFLNILPSDPPRALSSSVVIDALECRRSSLQTTAVDDINLGSGGVITPEKISKAIYTCLGIENN